MDQATPSSDYHTVLGVPFNELGVYHLPHGLKNLLICNSSLPDNPAVYYADISYYTKNVPDLKLYSLPSSIPNLSPPSPELDSQANDTKWSCDAALRHGTLVGTAWFRNVLKTRTIRMCLGDPEKVKGTVWAEMRDEQKHRHGEYVITVPESQEGDRESEGGFENSFEAELMSGYEAGTVERKRVPGGDHEDQPELETRVASEELKQQRRTFRWLRTHSKSDGLDNWMISRKMSVANFKIVDESGRIMAVFESNGLKSIKKQGKLRVYRQGDRGRVETNEGNEGMAAIGQEGDLEEVLMVLSYCVIQEKYRRGV